MESSNELPAEPVQIRYFSRLSSKYSSFEEHSQLLLKVPDTYENISGVGDGSDDSGSNHELLPGLGEVDDVDALVVALEHVGGHQAGAVLSTDLDLKGMMIRQEGSQTYVSSEHESNIVLLGLGISEL